MTDRSRQYAQVHNLLLFQRHLALRESASPLTLILDTLEQPAKPLIRRYIDNAKVWRFEFPSLNAIVSLCSFFSQDF